MKEAGNQAAKDQCNQQFEKLEIKEFYGTKADKESVKNRFKEMLKNSECDSLTISGHHTGYFAGEQSIGGSDDWKLDLDFMEELSCEPGCADWFSNVKSLFLLGCRTVRTQKVLNEEQPADHHTIRVIKKSKIPPELVSQHITVNQAYSSNLAEHNVLNDRYLMMFSESSLYGWGVTAPGRDNQSHESLPDFIKLVGKLQEKPEPTNTDDILNFINFMNSQSQTCKQYGSKQWVKHRAHYEDIVIKNEDGKEKIVQLEWLPTSCFLDDSSKEQFQRYQQMGCELTQALNSQETDQTKKADKIKEALTNILNLGEDGIRANFNRLMSLITNKKNKDEGWYSEVVNTLKQNEALEAAIVNGLQSRKGKMGFVRRADYLYFYRKMGWQDSNRDQEISKIFLTQLQEALETGKKEYNPKDIEDLQTIEDVKMYNINVTHQMTIKNSINQNNLEEWLFKNSKDEFNKLKDMLVKEGQTDLDKPPQEGGWNFSSS